MEATEAAVTRAAAKRWRAEALEPNPSEEDEERKEQEAAAVKIQAVHRGKAARKEMEERKEHERDNAEIQSLTNILRQALTVNTYKQAAKDEIVVASVSGSTYMMNKSVDLPSKIHHNKTA